MSIRWKGVVAGQRKKKKKLPEVLGWLRGAGFIGLCFGWGGLLLTDYFIPAVIAIYVGFAAAIIDLALEPNLSKFWKVVGGFLAVAMIAAFTWSIVLAKAPLEVMAMITDASYADGTVSDGITWKPEFTKLHVEITNASSHDYSALSLKILPSEPVTAVGTVGGPSGVYLEFSDGAHVEIQDVNPKTGERRVIPYKHIATNVGYILHCPSLPAKSSVTIDLALGTFKPDNEIPRTEDVIRVKDGFGTHWYGDPSWNVYAPRRNPDKLTISGDFKAVYRQREVNQSVQLTGRYSVQGLRIIPR